MDKNNKKKLEKALLEKALGYTTQEVVEEYGMAGDEFVLQKSFLKSVVKNCKTYDISMALNYLWIIL